MKKIIASLALASLLVATPVMAKSNHNNGPVLFQVIKESIVINKQDVRSAKLIKTRDHNYTVEISLTPQAEKRLAQLTESNIGQKMMMTVGNYIINKATIQSRLGSRFQISGVSKSVAESLVKALS